MRTITGHVRHDGLDTTYLRYICTLHTIRTLYMPTHKTMYTSCVFTKANQLRSFINIYH